MPHVMAEIKLKSVLGSGEALSILQKFFSALNWKHVWAGINPSAKQATLVECATAAPESEQTAQFMGKQDHQLVQFALRLVFKLFRSSLPLPVSLCT